MLDIYDAMFLVVINHKLKSIYTGVYTPPQTMVVDNCVLLSLAPLLRARGDHSMSS